MKFIARSRLAVACAVAGLAAGAPVGSAHGQCASTHTATLVPNDAMLGDLVGISALAMNGAGDRVLFGSVDHSHVGSDRGAAWVVSNPGTAFAQTVEIMPAVTWDGAWFAASLAMNAAGDRFVAGAPSGTSTIYAFRFDGTAWSEDWSTTSAQGWDWFGQSVAMDDAGDLIVAGAPRRLIPPNTYFYYGAVDIFRRQANTWVLEKSIVKTTDYSYGSWVALSGDGNLLAVRSFQQVNGSVDLCERDGGAWNPVANLHETVSHSDGGFGTAIDVDATGQTVVAGSYLDWRMGYMSGAVFIFRRGPSGWFLEGEMLLPTQGVSFQLGRSVSVNAAGDRVVAGAPGYNTPNGHMIGAVYEYARVNGVWQQGGVYTSPNPDKLSSFGRRVAVSATGRRWTASEPASDWYVSDGGFVHVFESPCTQPAVYCTAQTNSLGCAPHIAWEGPPSASIPGAFKLGLSNSRNRRSGLLFYGTTGPAAIPWYGGTLCVQPPLRRTPLQDSGGNPQPADDCSGSFTFDFNAWYPNDPALFTGAHVFAQYFSRDPSPTSQVNLSDALDFFVEP